MYTICCESAAVSDVTVEYTRSKTLIPVLLEDGLDDIYIIILMKRDYFINYSL